MPCGIPLDRTRPSGAREGLRQAAGRADLSRDRSQLGRFGRVHERHGLRHAPSRTLVYHPVTEQGVGQVQATLRDADVACGGNWEAQPVFSRVAIVNRGEAAMRLIHAVRDLCAETGTQIETVALYTDADRSATFVREADLAYPLGPASARPYLDYAVLERRA